MSKDSNPIAVSAIKRLTSNGSTVSKPASPRALRRSSRSMGGHAVMPRRYCHPLTLISDLVSVDASIARVLELQCLIVGRGGRFLRARAAGENAGPEKSQSLMTRGRLARTSCRMMLIGWETLRRSTLRPFTQTAADEQPRRLRCRLCLGPYL